MKKSGISRGIRYGWKILSFLIVLATILFTYMGRVSAAAESVPNSEDRIQIEERQPMCNEMKSLDDLAWLEENWYYDVDSESNNIVLWEYVGKDENVTVPGTLSLNGGNYQVLISENEGKGWDEQGIFFENEIIKQVTFETGVTVVNGNMENLFSGCTNLTTVNGILEGGVDMTGTFYGCNSLMSAPMLPDTLRILEETFAG